jgi:hypothetical protein
LSRALEIVSNFSFEQSFKGYLSQIFFMMQGKSNNMNAYLFFYFYATTVNIRADFMPQKYSHEA